MFSYETWNYNSQFLYKRLSIKDVRSQGKGGCPLRSRGRGSLDEESELFIAKSCNFSKIMVCPLGQEGGVEAVWTLDKERGLIFCDFVRTSFLD